MKSFEEMLKTHGGRDVLIRTLGYACLLSSGLTKGSLSRKFRIASSEFSHCRVVCRLLDDWPMLQYSLSYGTGKHENDSTLQMLAAGRLPAQCCGTISLYCGIARSLRTINLLQQKREKLSSVKGDSTRAECDLLAKEQLGHMLGVLRNVADLVNAISWLPWQFLWAGKLKPWHNGLLGLLSSLVSLTSQLLL
ncbi:hypothetical protein MTO96_025700 [Rhipicephalus appendiculatus]